jgi:hypothetical protein
LFIAPAVSRIPDKRRAVKRTPDMGNEVDFKAATDQLITRVTLPEIAAACGSSVNSIERARMDPESSSYRTPPAGWELAVAKLARERSGELQSLAEHLERQHRSRS